MCSLSTAQRAFDSLVKLTAIKPDQPDDRLIDTLILKKDSLNLINAIAQPQLAAKAQDNRRARLFKGEQVKGKGEGRVILLWGPSGTGKTFAAECIAENMGKRNLWVALTAWSCCH